MMPDFDVKQEMSKPISEQELKLEILTGKELLELDIPPMIWMSHMLIPNPGLIAISGQPGAHKTFFSMWLAMRIADGKRLFDEMDEPFFSTQTDEPKAANVLFIEEENTKQEIQKRFKQLKPMDNLENIAFQIERGFRFTDPEWCEAIFQETVKRNIKVLIFDSLLSCLGVKNENDNAELAAVLDIVRHEFVAKGLSVIFIHHPAKNQEGGNGLRGAGDILGKMDVHLCLTKDNEDKRKVTISYEKMRVADEALLSNFQVKLSGEGDLRSLQYRYLGVTKTKTEDMTEKIKAVMSTRQDGWERSELTTALGLEDDNGTFSRSWDKMKKEKIVYRGVDKRFYLKV